MRLPEGVEPVGRQEKRKITMLDGILAGHVMRSCPEVLGVEVFGSTAREGLGKDLDLLLLVSDANAVEFLSMKGPDKKSREKDAVRILGKEFAQLLKELHRIHPSVEFDIMLAPVNWRERTDQMAPFWHDLHQDAVRIA